MRPMELDCYAMQCVQPEIANGKQNQTKLAIRINISMKTVSKEGLDSILAKLKYLLDIENKEIKNLPQNRVQSGQSLCIISGDPCLLH